MLRLVADWSRLASIAGFKELLVALFHCQRLSYNLLVAIPDLERLYTSLNIEAKSFLETETLGSFIQNLILRIPGQLGELGFIFPH